MFACGLSKTITFVLLCIVTRKYWEVPRYKPLLSEVFQSASDRANLSTLCAARQCLNWAAGESKYFPASPRAASPQSRGLSPMHSSIAASISVSLRDVTLLSTGRVNCLSLQRYRQLNQNSTYKMAFNTFPLYKKWPTSLRYLYLLLIVICNIQKYLYFYYIYIYSVILQ